MIHTLTMIVIPSLGCIPEVRRILKDERFTIKSGTHIRPDGSEPAVGIACADFHDVSVVLEKLSGHIKQKVYLQDARHRLFIYQPMRNTLEPIGHVYGYDETQTINTGHNFFDFGSLRWAYLPL